MEPTDHLQAFAGQQGAEACAAPARGARLWTLVSVAVIVAVALAAYANSFHGAFVFDDIRVLVTSEPRHQSEALWKGLPLVPDVFGRPLALNYRLGGLDPWGYHTLNLGIHVAAALVLLGIVRRTLLSDRLREPFGHDAPPLALAVALLWTVHPLQTESVTYIVQRREALMGLFFLLTLYAVIRAAASRRRLAWYVAALLFCWIGMGTKDVMVAVPVIALAYDRTFLAGSWRSALRQRGLLYALMAATWLTVMRPGIARLQTSGMGVPEMDMGTWDYARSQFGGVAHYLCLSIWPSSLCLDYNWPVARTWSEVLLPASLIVALLALTAWAFWRRPAWEFPGVWFFIILAPTSSLITIKFLAFEHRMYLSLAAVVALAVVAGYLLGKHALARLAASARARAVIGWGLAAVLVAGTSASLGYTTARRNNDYRSEVALWEDTARKRPQNPRAHGNLAMALLKAGDAGRAVEELTLAMKFGWTRPDVLFNRGAAYQKKGDLDNAIRDYTRALQMNPITPRRMPTAAPSGKPGGATTWPPGPDQGRRTGARHGGCLEQPRRRPPGGRPPRPSRPRLHAGHRTGARLRAGLPQPGRRLPRHKGLRQSMACCENVRKTGLWGRRDAPEGTLRSLSSAAPVAVGQAEKLQGVPKVYGRGFFVVTPSEVEDSRCASGSTATTTARFLDSLRSLEMTGFSGVPESAGTPKLLLRGQTLDSPPALCFRIWCSNTVYRRWRQASGRRRGIQASVFRRISRGRHY